MNQKFHEWVEEDLPINSNPEDFLIALEEGESYEGEYATDGLPMSQLIEAGHRFDIRGEEIPVPCEEDLNNDSFEQRFRVVEGVDPDYDNNDPPMENRGSWWAGPFEEQPVEDPEPPLWLVEKALLLNDRIQASPPKRVAKKYFHFGLSQYPRGLRRFLQRGIEIKLQGLLEKVWRWEKRAAASAENPEDAEAIKERAKVAKDWLSRCLLKGELPTREFAPIVEDQFVIADRQGRFELEKDAHLREEERIRQAENEDWFSRMYRNQDGKLVKNCSGEEALWMLRNKLDREYRFDRALDWVNSQTNPKALKKALQKLNHVYAESRKECFQKNNWAEVRYRKDQKAQLTQAIQSKLKEA